MIDKDRLGLASVDEPLFARVGLYDAPEGLRNDTDVPYAEATVAVVGYVRDGRYHREHLRMAVLQDVAVMQEPMTYREPRVGDYILRPMDSFEGEELEPTAELRESYDSFRSLDEGAPIVISGRLYGESARFNDRNDPDHLFPNFDPIDGTEMKWVLRKGDTLKDGTPVSDAEGAQKWLLENHPDYYMGCLASRQGSSGSGFAVAVAVPCSEYPAGSYETAAGRLEHARSVASGFGVEAGPSEYAAAVHRARTADLGRLSVERPDKTADGPEVGI